MTAPSRCASADADELEPDASAIAIVSRHEASSHRLARAVRVRTIGKELPPTPPPSSAPGRASQSPRLSLKRARRNSLCTRTLARQHRPRCIPVRPHPHHGRKEGRTSAPRQAPPVHVSETPRANLSRSPSRSRLYHQARRGLHHPARGDALRTSSGVSARRHWMRN
ncbi:hypothetical protein B0H13DRAFT_406097 [Mycena leptocephala]|nr:hypothetical protein B0H13DRAFT_406097 [Mycena leptocephala]